MFPKPNTWCFLGKKMEDCQITLSINQMPLTRVFKSKFLGVIIDDKLTFKDHIAHVSSKVAKGIGILCKARRVLNRDSLITLYYSFIYPHLSYCNQIWGNLSLNALKRLDILQKRAIRIICGVHPRTHTLPLFKQLHILNLVQINKFLIGQMMFKFHKEQLPYVMSNLFQYNSEFHEYQTRHSNFLHLPKFKSELGKRSLAFWGAKVWNSILSIGVTLDVEPITFKHTLRKIALSDRI